MNFGTLLVLVAKDLKVFLTDRKAVILSFVAPLILASFFAVVFGGGPGADAPGEAARIRVGVADLDDSEVSRAIVSAMAADRSLDLSTDPTPVEARERVRKGDAVVAVVIPSGFGTDAPRAMFGPAKKPELDMLYDPTRRAESGMVRGLATQHAMEAVASRIFGPASASAISERIAEVESSSLSPTDKDSLKALLEGAARWSGRTEARAGGGFSIPFEAREEAVTAGDQEARTAANAHAFGGMAVQFLLLGSIEMGVGLLSERQKGLWRRLRAAPVSRHLILLARVVSGTTVSLLILAVIFGFGALTFGLRVVGSPIAFALVCVLYASTAASLGLLIAAIGRTPQAARGLSVLAVLLMVMLGGAWVPTFAFPAWLRRLTVLIPTRWAVDGFDATLARGSSLVEAGPILLALLGFFTAFTTLAIARFRWDPE